MLNGELTPRSNLIGELTGGVFYGTNDYEELINKPSVNGVELVGNKTTSDLGIDIPTELSELTNDVGFITSADVPTKTSDLTNDSGYITTADVSAVGLSGDYDDLTNKPTIPTLTSQLTNDSGFITNASVPTMTSQLFNDSGYITSADIPTDVSAFTNDAGYITSSDIPTDVSAFNNDAGYLTSSDVAEVAISGDYDDLLNKPTIPENLSDLTDTTITTPSNADLLAYDSSTSKWVNTDLKGTASGSIATFNNGGNGIPVSEFECEIVAQQASGTPTPDNPLPITGHSESDIVVCGKNLVNTANITDVVYNDLGQTRKGFIIRGGGTYTLSVQRAYTSETYIFAKALNADGTFGSVQYVIRGTTTANITLTIENGGTLLVYSPETANLFETIVNYCSLQIEVGNTATTFEAYNGTTYTVAFGQTIYGGRLIYANGQWSIEETIKGHKLSELTWVYNGTLQCFLNIGNTEIDRNVDDSHYLPDLKCSCFQTDSVTNTIYQRNNYRIASNATGDIFISCSDYTNVTDFINAFGNETIIYPLATPDNIPITSSTRVKTISGNNNIYSNTGDCELKYFTDKADNIAELIKAFVL